MHFSLAILTEDHEEAQNNTESLTERKMIPYIKNLYSDGIWDWYEIGGQYNGLFANYDPMKDPANFEICPQCNGTGDHLGWVFYLDENGHEILPEVEFAPEMTKILSRSITKGENEFLPDEYVELVKIVREKMYPVAIRTFIEKAPSGESHAHIKANDGCNSCSGTGLRRNFKRAKPHPSNVIKVSELPWDDKEKIAKMIPAAIIETSGAWRWDEDYRSNKVWKKVALRILEKNKDKTIILVDVHM